MLAGPDPAVDRQEAIDELVVAAVEHGAGRVRVETVARTEFTFEIAAGSPEAACELVTTIFRSVYGLNWWAEVSPVRLAPAALRFTPAVAWN